MSAPEWLITVPTATVVLMAIMFATSLVLQTTNRVLINRFLGWDNYRSMQRELSAFRKESMAAARSKDPKQLEKMKKKQSQINAINAKMMKPQMLNMAISVAVMPVWFSLKPIFDAAQINGVAGVAIIPHFGPLPYWAWCMISSFFLGALLMRIFGTTLLE
ncbi:MAG: hypothetical protein FWD52_04780 [Candidatus Bathyarchaeota archaeon]|nr:hypothetical protein [Candidatus Termiticorpusculum sp.]